MAPYYVALNGTVWAVFVGSAALTAVLKDYHPFPRLVLSFLERTLIGERRLRLGKSSETSQ